MRDYCPRFENLEIAKKTFKAFADILEKNIDYAEILFKIILKNKHYFHQLPQYVESIKRFMENPRQQLVEKYKSQIFAEESGSTLHADAGFLMESTSDTLLQDLCLYQPIENDQRERIHKNFRILLFLLDNVYTTPHRRALIKAIMMTFAKNSWFLKERPSDRETIKSILLKYSKDPNYQDIATEFMWIIN